MGAGKPRLRRCVWLLPVWPLVLAGCSWIPLVGSSGGPRLTNPAVEACERKASELGYDDPGERQSAPSGGGRYAVTLDVRHGGGFGQVACAWDPAKGAEIEPPKPSSR
jgi:hypothetical protein